MMPLITSTTRGLGAGGNAAGTGIARMGAACVCMTGAGLASHASGAPGRNNCATALPVVLAMSVSSGLRSTSWMLVWVLDVYKRQVRA